MSATAVLCRAYKQKSFRFLKWMLWMMINTNVISLIEGIVLLYMNVENVRDQHPKFYYSF